MEIRFRQSKITCALKHKLGQLIWLNRITFDDYKN